MRLVTVTTVRLAMVHIPVPVTVLLAPCSGILLLLPLFLLKGLLLPLFLPTGLLLLFLLAPC